MVGKIDDGFLQPNRAANKATMLTTCHVFHPLWRRAVPSAVSWIPCFSWENFIRNGRRRRAVAFLSMYYTFYTIYMTVDIPRTERG